MLLRLQATGNSYFVYCTYPPSTICTMVWYDMCLPGERRQNVLFAIGIQF